ncbi:hypothetical protein JCM6882_008099 [Rhodosporidiobolus microsporus]
MLDDPCSRFLPPVHPPPPASLSLTCISRLSTFFAPTSLTVDLRFSLPTLSSGSVPPDEAQKLAEEEDHEDGFERRYARGWLERVVAIGLRVIGRGEDEEGEWEEVVEKASGLLAFLSGPSAQGSSSTTYLLPSPPALSHPTFSILPTPPPTRPASATPFSHPSDSAPSSTSPGPSISLTIRDTTLLSNSTGHRTWGAAALLAQSLASSPSLFFPPSSASSPFRPLRVLELGSGTGLVGLTAGSVLSRLSRTAVVTLTDGGPEPASVLSNLAENVGSNVGALEGVQVEVQELDWREFFPLEEGGKGKTVPEEEKYDVVLASDVAYEPGMAEALHAAVAGLLRFPPPSSPSSTSNAPSSSTSSDQPSSAFHLIIPLRRTHTHETATVDRLFPLSSSLSSSSSSSSPPLDPSLLRPHPSTPSTTYRLVSRSREDITGPDGFGGRGGGAGTVRGRGRGRAEGEMVYRCSRVEWEEVRE